MPNAVLASTRLARLRSASPRDEPATRQRIATSAPKPCHERGATERQKEICHVGTSLAANGQVLMNWELNTATAGLTPPPWTGPPAVARGSVKYSNEATIAERLGAANNGRR